MNLKFIKKNKWEILLILLFLIIKLTILFSYEVIPDSEGERQGILANQILEGENNVPLEYFQFYPLEGGSFISSIFTIPIFYFFGINGYALRLIPMLISLAIMMVLISIVKELFNKKISIIAGLLYIFSPVFYTLYSYDPITVHLWPLLFILIGIHLSIIVSRYGKTIPTILLGLVLGFGLYLHDSFFLGILFCGIILLNSNRIKYFYDKLMFSFLIGFIPKLIMTSSYVSSPFYNIRRLFLFDFMNITIILEAFISKFINFWTTLFPAALSLNVENNFFLSLLISYLFLLAIILNLWRYKKDLKNIFFNIFKIKNKEEINYKAYFTLFSLLFVFIYSISNFNVLLVMHFNPFRYFIYLIPLMIIVLTDVLYWSYNHKISNIKLMGIVIFVLMMVFSVYGNMNLIKIKNIGKDSIYSPYDYRWLGGSFMRKSNDNFTDAISKCDILSDKYLPDCYRGVGFAIIHSRWIREFNYDPSKIDEACNTFKIENRQFCYEGAGERLDFLEPVLSYTSTFNITNSFNLCKNVNKEYTKNCLRGLFGLIEQFKFLIERDYNFYYEEIGETHQIKINDLVGVGFFRLFYINPQFTLNKCEELNNNLTHHCKNNVAFMIGNKVIKDLIEQKYICLDIGEYKNSCFKGIGNFIAWNNYPALNKSMDICSSIDENQKNINMCKLGALTFFKEIIIKKM